MKTTATARIEMLMKKMIEVKEIAKELADDDVLEFEEAFKYETLLDCAFAVLEAAWKRDHNKPRPQVKLHAVEWTAPLQASYRDHVIKYAPEGFWRVLETGTEEELFASENFGECQGAIDEVMDDLATDAGVTQ